MYSRKQFLRAVQAFTLIELLVVIAIIAILAGLILAGVMGVKTKAAVSKARSDVAMLAQAIADYQSKYSSYPVTKAVWDFSKSKAENKANPDKANPDFTFGTSQNDNVIKQGLPKIQSYNYSFGNPKYDACNAEIVAVLRNAAQTNSLASIVTVLNPKKITFIEPPLANNTISPGVGPDGVFRDPWGNPYIISLDLDMDGKVIDGLYGAIAENFNLPVEIPGSVLVWSFGPDGMASTTNSPTTGVNKDNILSWEK